MGSLAVEAISLALLMRFGDIMRTLLKYLTSWSNVLMLACSISLSFIPFMLEQEGLLQRVSFLKYFQNFSFPLTTIVYFITIENILTQINCLLVFCFGLSLSLSIILTYIYFVTHFIWKMPLLLVTHSL